MKKVFVLAISLLFMSVGCVTLVEPVVDEEVIIIEDDSNDDEVIIIEDDPVVVDTWLSLPYSVKAIIEPYVYGYFSPKLNRYDEYLYPSSTPYDCFDLPCFVQDDFNGDGYDDYALIFSQDIWNGYSWEMNSQLLVLLSSPYGLELTCVIELGTVIFDPGMSTEEFWAINWIPAGYHTLVTYINGIEINETIYLDNSGFFLASHDPDEESIFYAEGDTVYEVDWSDRNLNKRAVTNEQQRSRKGKIPFKKNKENRKSMLKSGSGRIER